MPPTPKENEVMKLMKPADGVIKNSLARFMAPAEVQRFVTHIAITDLKFRLMAVAVALLHV